MALWDDLADLAISAGTDTFGRPCVYRWPSLTEVTFTGIYDATHEPTKARLDTLTEVSTEAPVLEVRLRDFPSGHPRQGAEVDVEGLDDEVLEYTVEDIKPKDYGSLLLILRDR